MWDTLRINEKLTPGADLVNNVLSYQAALWPEGFWPQEPVVYNSSDGDDPTTYPTLSASGGVDPLIDHSWAFWFRQDGAEAKNALTPDGKFYNSRNNEDKILGLMRSADYFFNPHHFNRGVFKLDLNPFPPRKPANLRDIPTLIRHGERTISNYIGSALTLGTCLYLPLGRQVYIGNDQDNDYAITIESTESGWRNNKHSDFKDLPIFYIFPWYAHIQENIIH
jgi:hypothetical protein